MRCKACDTILNDYECRRKNPEGIHYDLCSGCYRYVRDAQTEDEQSVDVDSVMRYSREEEDIRNIL
jgi:hypothetical protein